MESWHMNQETTTILTILLPLLILLVGLSFAVQLDTYIGKRQKRVFLLAFALGLALICQNYLEMRVAEGPARDGFRTLLSVLGYSMRPLVLLLFFYLLEPKGSFLLGWILVGLNCLIQGVTLFYPLAFSIEENHYHGGPLSNACLCISLILMGWLLWLTWRRYRETPGKEILLPMLIVPMILGSLVLDNHVGSATQPVSFLTVAMVNSYMLYYLWLHLQFVRAHEQDLRAQQRMQIMLTQIKPHFLYNTLGAIEALCDTDPRAAKAATIRFSKYLRSNLNAITEQGMIPFEKELSHTRLYLELEQTRFEEALQVEYHIECTDFFLPALSLQPLAENAVRHGVRGKEDGRGTVVISSRETENAYEVSVQDDGPGFDPARLPAEDGEHIGIQNVRARLEGLGASLLLRSAPGEGTLAVIRVPKKGA